MRFEPIVPKKKVIRPAVSLAAVGGALIAFALGVTSRLSDYPAQRPRSRYRRTGELGRRWTRKGPSVTAAALVVEVGSNLKYAPFVEGFRTRRPKQTRGARQAGWPSVEDVAKKEWKRARPRVLAALRAK